MNQQDQTPNNVKQVLIRFVANHVRKRGVPQWMIWHYSLANIEYVFGLPIQKTFKGAIFSELISFLNSADDHW